MSYPIFITLEAPIRLSPEQAAKDFFEAASHGLLAYKRMWLLLSDEGKESQDYASFPGFKAYWKKRLATLQKGKRPFWNPLVFTVKNFRSTKARDAQDNETQFEVHITRRGADPKLPPIEVIKVSMSMVKGPDNEWYLDKGNLPGMRL